MHILVLEHQPDAPAALFGEWALSRGHRVTVFRVAQVEAWPDPLDYDAIVALGSETSVQADPRSWVEAEMALLSTAHASDMPVLGICFGGQALAKALGGEVRRAAEPEIRWRAIDTTSPILPGPWFFWHEDEFSLPPGARLLSGSARQTIAFASGRSLGLQFHPEADAKVIGTWIGGARAKLAHQGIDPDELIRHAPGAGARARAQFDRVADWWKNTQ
jgi:GMP synthase-like glutamine amidotransferase